MLEKLKTELKNCNDCNGHCCHHEHIIEKIVRSSIIQAVKEFAEKVRPKANEFNKFSHVRQIRQSMDSKITLALAEIEGKWERE